MDTDKFLSEIWGALKLFLDPKTQILADERNLAVLLAADAENFDRFMALKEFRDILHALGLKADIYSLQCAQLGAINALKFAKISKSKLLAALEILQTENIISAEHFKRLSAFLCSLGTDLPTQNEHDGSNFKKSDVFHQKIDALNDICERILSLNPSAHVANTAAKARQKARELEFNVAVTGVINAGKSTLLNALLGKKILGASNVPETVNLTVLKYAPKPFAKVNFWSEAELRELGIAQDQDDEIAEIYGDLSVKFEGDPSKAAQNLSDKFGADGDASQAKFDGSSAKPNLTALSNGEKNQDAKFESLVASSQSGKTNALNQTQISRDIMQTQHGKFAAVSQPQNQTKDGESQKQMQKNSVQTSKNQAVQPNAAQNLIQESQPQASQICSEPPASKTVKTDEIKRYTSADSKYAKFVKSVELYENLELLKDNVRIIDTPGIDDAVALREELVRRFMRECDLMVHLMNVSQSATQKDLDFIVSSLQNSHAVRLAVLLTHADVLKQGELNEVAAYAKKSVEERTRELGVGAEFFAVSAKSYFEGGQNSGVEEFKEYLYETLFGQNSQKSRLGIEAYKKELGRVCAQFAADTQSEILKLTGSNLSLSQKLSELNEQKAALASRLEDVRGAVKEELERLDTAKTATSYELGLRSLAQTLKQRVADDINYAASKKQKIDPQRLARIAQTTIKDGVAALMRQNRNEIVRQITACAQNIALKFGEFESKTAAAEVFSINDYLNSKGINLECAQVADAVTSAANSGAQGISEAAKVAAEEFLGAQRIKNFVFELSEFEKSEFKKRIEAALKEQEKTLAISEEALKNELAALAQTSGASSRELERLNSQSEAINAINLELQSV
ncbi:dynamin family protein [Campylobacter rectus]|uniref:dynamin family protein n=1 Tax=Campylobacter rectus TaxID=203 RepID=UPI000F5DEE2A|nr:dynamin family protein [Campylobacter rectus]RRD53706.1 dynamin [Campylobacter rectus]